MKANFLNTLTFVTVAQSVRTSKPSAAVRQNGQIVFSAAANKIVDYPKNQYFKAGADAEGNIYLIPATAETPNVIKATKNNDSFQFRQDNVLSALGAQYKDRYEVAAGQEGEGKEAVHYFKLTKLSKEAAAEEAAAETTAKSEPAKNKGGKK
jgi:hypothetical protein